jgi:hypothetical protein
MRSSSGRIGLYLIALFSLFLFSCSSGFIKSMSALVVLQGAIAKEFKEENVLVTLNNSTTLIVTFVNSPLNNAAWTERSKRALETALFIRKRYPDIASIHEMWVNFERRETRYVVGQLFGDARGISIRSERQTAERQ